MNKLVVNVTLCFLCHFFPFSQPVGCIRTRIVIRGSSKLFGKCHNCVQSSHKTACVLINFACVQGK